MSRLWPWVRMGMIGFVLASGCDSAKAGLDKCAALESKDVPGAIAACKAAIDANPTSQAGVSAAHLLAKLVAKQRAAQATDQPSPESDSVTKEATAKPELPPKGSVCADLDALYQPLIDASVEVEKVLPTFSRANKANTRGTPGLVENFLALQKACRTRAEVTRAAQARLQSHGTLAGEKPLVEEVLKAYGVAATADEGFAKLLDPFSDDLRDNIVRIAKLGELYEGNLTKAAIALKRDHRKRCGLLGAASGTKQESATSSAMAVIEAWLDAQNERDFHRYADLYAPNFVGIKRVGERSREFDRDGWLADRRKMFAKPMIVTGSDRRERQEGTKTIMQFTQHWSSGSFADEGSKEIAIQDGKIVREELLNSEVVSR